MDSLLAMQEGGMDIPSLHNRPRLNKWVSEYWEAFQTLIQSRAVHQGGIGPIPLSEIVAYINCVYIRDVDDRLTFIKMIQSLDNVYVKHINKKAQQRAKAERAKRPKIARKR